MIFSVAMVLVMLHTVDGRPVRINPAQLTQIGPPRGDQHRGLSRKVNCVLRFTDGGYVSVAEDCDEVRRIVESVK